MDAQQFLAEFGHIANAPGGVGRLRELILALAFKGELCPQSQSRIDDLLEDIEQQRNTSNVETSKQRLVRQGTRGAQADGPYLLPENWRWVSLSTVGRTWGQKKPESDFVYIDVSSIDNKAGTLKSALEVLNAGAAPSRARKIVKSGTIIYSTVRPYLLNIAIIDREFDHEPIASTAFAVVHPWAGIEARYIYLYLRSPYFVRYVESVQIGMAYPAISDEKFYSGVVPLPPTEEQARIVAKVDELMALCDQLEKLQQDRRKLQNALRQSTLKALASAESPHELQESWQRLQANFGLLFSDPRDVDVLRGLVLDMGVKGYLVHRTGSWGTADDLLSSLDERKQAIAKHRKLRLQKQLPQLSEDEVPYACPEGWRWVRLGRIAELINGDRGKNYPNKDEYVSEGVPWINTGHIEPNGTLTVHHMNFITREKFEALNSGKIEPNDLVYCLRGATFGKTAFVSPYTEGAIASSLMIIRPLDARTARYVYYYLISPFGRSQIFRFDNGTAQPNLSANSVGLFSFPLPPLEEQERIVKRIEYFMLVCDALEEQQRSSRRVAELLSSAVISALTGIAIKQDEVTAVKAPQTELIASLRLGTLPDVKDQAPLATLLARRHGEMSARDLWQRFGGEIDAFYAQLKTEVSHGWITEPTVAEVRAKPTETAEA